MSKAPFFLLLLSFFFTHPLHANADEQFWFVVRKNIQKNNFDFSVQGQWRLSNESDKIYEEQINLSLGQNFDSYKYDFIFTLGTINFYDRVREYRYAAQVEKNFKLHQGLIYNFRLRQEARDFVIINEWAHRFRLRNQLEYRLKNKYFSKLNLSHEFNFYLNSFEAVDKGFSSHRTVLGLFKNYEDTSLGFSYVYDVQLIETPEFTRHSFQVSYFF